MNKALRIQLPYATFMVEGNGIRVLKAAPIARWMEGRSWTVVCAWVQGKGGTWEWMNE